MMSTRDKSIEVIQRALYAATLGEGSEAEQVGYRAAFSRALFCIFSNLNTAQRRACGALISAPELCLASLSKSTVPALGNIEKFEPFLRLLAPAGNQIDEELTPRGLSELLEDTLFVKISGDLESLPARLLGGSVGAALRVPELLPPIPLPRISGYRPLQLLSRGGGSWRLLARDPRGRRLFLEVEELERGEEPATWRGGALPEDDRLLAPSERGVSGQFYWAGSQNWAGLTLSQLLRRGARKLSRDAQLLLSQDLLDGLAALHRQSWCHGLFTPHEVQLDTHFRLRVSGSPLWRRSGKGSWSSGRLRPAYLSPERLQGSGPSLSDDIWACGVILHLIFAGAPPWRGTLAALSEQQRTPKIDPRIDGVLADFIRKCLSTDLNERWPNAVEAASVFRDLSSTLSEELSQWRRARGWTQLLKEEALERFSERAVSEGAAPDQLPSTSQAQSWLRGQKLPLLAHQTLRALLPPLIAESVTLAQLNAEEEESIQRRDRQLESFKIRLSTLPPQELFLHLSRLSQEKEILEQAAGAHLERLEQKRTLIIETRRYKLLEVLSDRWQALGYSWLVAPQQLIDHRRPPLQSLIGDQSPAVEEKSENPKVRGEEWTLFPRPAASVSALEEREGERNSADRVEATDPGVEHERPDEQMHDTAQSEDYERRAAALRERVTAIPAEARFEQLEALAAEQYELEESRTREREGDSESEEGRS